MTQALAEAGLPSGSAVLIHVQLDIAIESRLAIRRVGGAGAIVPPSRVVWEACEDRARA